MLEPSRGVGPELLKKTLPFRFGRWDTAYNRLRGVGDPPAFYFRLQNVAAADAELLPDGLGDDYLEFIFHSNGGHMDRLTSPTTSISTLERNGLLRPLDWTE